jgi:hypothetical protein
MGRPGTSGHRADHWGGSGADGSGGSAAADVAGSCVREWRIGETPFVRGPLPCSAMCTLSPLASINRWPMEAGPGYRWATAFVNAAEVVERATPAVTEAIKSRLEISILFSRLPWAAWPIVLQKVLKRAVNDGDNGPLHSFDDYGLTMLRI